MPRAAVLHVGWEQIPLAVAVDHIKPVVTPGADAGEEVGSHREVLQQKEQNTNIRAIAKSATVPQVATKPRAGTIETPAGVRRCGR